MRDGYIIINLHGPTGKNYTSLELWCRPVYSFGKPYRTVETSQRLPIHNIEIDVPETRSWLSTCTSSHIPIFFQSMYCWQVWRDTWQVCIKYTLLPLLFLPELLEKPHSYNKYRERAPLWLWHYTLTILKPTSHNQRTIRQTLLLSVFRNKFNSVKQTDISR